MAAIDLKIDQLMLDQKNPRINEAANQREALQRIIADQDSKLAELAESIIEDGLNPMERLLVIRSQTHSGKYDVLEGNRRLAALKILTNPTVLTGLDIRAPLQKRFETLATQFDKKSVEPVSCFEVADRAASRLWIEMRHTGENDGRGIVDWSGVQAARFRGSDPALQALDFVRKHADITPEQRELLDHRFPITTLDRLLSTPDVRELIGASIEDGKLFSSLPPEEAIKPLKKMVIDLAEKKMSVTDLKRKPQMVAYVRGFPQEATPDLNKRVDARPLEEIEAEDFPKRTKSKPKRRRPDASDRKFVVPRGCPVHVTDARIAEVYKELRTLKAADFPNAVAVLLRVFLELSVDRYLVSNSMPLTVTVKGHVKDKSLAKKAQEAVDHIVASGVASKKDFAPIVRALNNTASPLHPDTLNAYVHNKYAAPTEKDLFAAWTTAQILFEKIWP